MLVSRNTVWFVGVVGNARQRLRTTESRVAKFFREPFATVEKMRDAEYPRKTEEEKIGKSLFFSEEMLVSRNTVWFVGVVVNDVKTYIQNQIKS